MSEASPLVGVVMGSDSDWSVMEAAAKVLAELDVPFEVDVVSAHRTPQRLVEYGSTAAARGLRVIVAGAGGAAHLPGMLASLTSIPVVGVPVPLAHMDGMDSLLSIVQMPAGVPVATVGVGNGRNGGLLAARIIAAGESDSDHALRLRLDELREDAAHKVAVAADALRARRSAVTGFGV
ncbi:MAG: 5-(carboxyamino)imidazole ribonucleotide mutase [Actinomycetales bacterium]|nr:5-(carboxyamino)imidazole ribonucleotide mutase [Actinomycetales bacterium]